MSELVLTGPGINLAAATAHDASHLGPVEVDLLAATPAHGLDPSGLPALREQLALRHGLDTDGLIITNGAHHALALVLGALCRPGERVIVEEHTYAGFLDLLEGARVQAIAIERDADGAEPRALERAIRLTQPRLVYLMPRVHAPSGATTSPQRREELAAVLSRHACITVSDDTLAELGPRAGPLATDSLITVGTLSKSLWSGLRVGWVHASADVRERIVSHRARVDLGSAVAAQQIALQLVGRMDTLLAERTAQLRDKAERLRRGLPPEWTVAAPDGGLCLWARLPVPDAAPYVDAAARAGVLVMPGAVARAGRTADPHIRLCFDRPAGLLDEAITRLCAAWATSAG
jgi:DNA-binding transcriptional MocR family regulator